MLVLKRDVQRGDFCLSGRDIFISYSREDRTAARYFAECFVKEGFSVWWDAALHSGEVFDEVIETELKAAKAVVVLWSPRSVASRWVRAEATIADRRKKLVPVIIEPCERPIIFELTHTADLSGWTGDRCDDPWPTFVQDLRRLVERSRQADATVPKPGAEPLPGRRLDLGSNGNREAASSGGIGNELIMARANFERPVGQVSERPSALRSPRVPPTVEQSDHTQISTGAHDFDLFGQDEFHCLEITIGDRLEKRFIVSPLGLKIGRSAPADVVFADARVSRTHCFVELAGNGLRVSDLNSTNGTYIDGERISEKAILGIGSVLKVGNTTLTHEVRTRADV